MWKQSPLRVARVPPPSWRCRGGSRATATRPRRVAGARETLSLLQALLW